MQRSIVEQGKLAREGGGKRGDPYRYRLLFPCSQDIAGTREQETEKPADTSINTERNLVPASEQESFIVPENDPTQDTAIGGSKTEQEPGVPDTDSDTEYL